MGLKRLAVAAPSANTDTTIFTADNQYLMSVIMTNKDGTSANMRVWVEPSGSSSTSQYAYIIYDIPLDGNNSYETFRFSVNQNDVVKVRVSTANISVAAYGLVQYDVNLGVGISSYQPTAPSNPVDGLIWIDSDATVTSGTTVKPAYVWDSVANAWRDFAGIAQNGIFICTSSTRPSTPTEGAIIYETDTDKIYSYNGSTWMLVGGVIVCTSSTRPSPATEGMLIYETDTDKVLAYDGSAWNPVSGAATYAATAPSSPNVGSIWVDSDDTGSTLNSSDFVLKADVPAYAATGAGGDHIFFENGQTITTSYTISTNKNALTAGPVTINNSVTVTIPSGSSWVIL